MERGRPCQPLVLEPTVRAELTSLALSRTLPHDLVRRALIDAAVCRGGEQHGSR